MAHQPRAGCIRLVLQPSSSVNSGCPGSESSILVSSRCACSISSHVTDVSRPLLVDVGLKFERAEMQMIRWMCGICMKDRRKNEELRRLVGVEPITTVIRSDRLRWYGHEMRKGDEDWVKKCMEFRV